MRYLCILMAASIGAAVRMAWSGPSNELDAASLSIGYKEWPSVTNGLVFIDGQFITPPYVVSRREGEILLNGLHLDWVMQWPPKKKTPPPSAPTMEPVMPSSITKQTTRYDKDYLTYISNIRQYLITKFGTKKGVEMMVDVYRKLPCIKTAEREENDPDSINVVWADGSKGGIRQIPFPRGELNLTKKQATEYIDHMAEIYVHALENNNYFMTGSTVGRRGTHESFTRTLVPLAETLKIAKDEADFLSIMKTNQPVGGMSEAAFRAFYKHKDDLPKWEPRIRKELKGK